MEEQKQKQQQPRMSQGSQPGNGEEPTKPLNLDLLIPFTKCIQPYLKSRTDGNLCLNCFTFFTRDSKDFPFHNQARTSRISTFVKLHSIRNLEGLVQAVQGIIEKEGNRTVRPDFNRQECAFAIRSLHESVSSLTLQVNDYKKCTRQEERIRGLEFRVAELEKLMPHYRALINLNSPTVSLDRSIDHLRPQRTKKTKRRRSEKFSNEHWYVKSRTNRKLKESKEKKIRRSSRPPQNSSLRLPKPPQP